MTDQEPRTERRCEYVRFLPMSLCPTDNDAHGRLSSAACCAVFANVIDDFLKSEGLLDMFDRHSGGLSAHTFEVACRFHRASGFPDNIDAGLRIGQLGNCSVRYEIGLFRADEEKPVATGHVVQVFVARENDKPATIPAEIRARLARLSRPA